MKVWVIPVIAAVGDFQGANGANVLRALVPVQELRERPPAGHETPISGGQARHDAGRLEEEAAVCIRDQAAAVHPLDVFRFDGDNLARGREFGRLPGTDLFEDFARGRVHQAVSDFPHHFARVLADFNFLYLLDLPHGRSRQNVVPLVRNGQRQEQQRAARRAVSVYQLLKLAPAPFGDLGRTHRAEPDRAARLHTVEVSAAVLRAQNPDPGRRVLDHAVTAGDTLRRAQLGRHALQAVLHAARVLPGVPGLNILTREVLNPFTSWQGRRRVRDQDAADQT